LKPERWGSPLVQEKYQAEKACDKRHPYCIIIIIIIINFIILGEEPLPVQLLERSGSKWENTIQVDFNEAGCENERWMELAQEFCHCQ